jgi:two-component system, OmpR family, phosphate regulon sensor histidine kinase PhoR
VALRLKGRVTSLVFLPLVLVAAAFLAYVTIRTNLQADKLGRQSMLEATLGLANEKADRLDKQIVEEDNVIFAIADPSGIPSLEAKWLPTARRETPTVRAVLVLDEARDVLAFASRAGGAFWEEEAFRRLVVRRMISDMELGAQKDDELRHLHHAYAGQSYLVSYWQRTYAGRRYLVVAWHDIGRIVRETLPTLYTEVLLSGARPTRQSRVNVVDEDGRIIYGPPLRTGEFTVGVRFPTTLYNWRLQVSPTASEELAAHAENRRILELATVTLSCVVIVAGVAAILFATEKQRRISALESDFVANVSHELKTPLALVRMFGEMLQSGRVSSEDKRKEYLDIIVRESERLSALIENVLDFARATGGREAYEFARGDVGDAVAKAVSVYRYRAEREGKNLTIAVEEGLPELRIDERAIQLAVINLVDNALKYAPDGETIAIKAAREGATVAVRVTDQGPGVPDEDKTRIFERFVRGTRVSQGEAQRSRREGPVRGSGIGLALVKHIAESHGGRAWVEAASGSGATFVFTIPVLV